MTIHEEWNENGMAHEGHIYLERNGSPKEELLLPEEKRRNDNLKTSQTDKPNNPHRKQNIPLHSPN